MNVWRGPWQGAGRRYWELFVDPVWANLFENKGDTRMKKFSEKFYLQSSLGFTKIDAANCAVAKKKAFEWLKERVIKAHKDFTENKP